MTFPNAPANVTSRLRPMLSRALMLAAVLATPAVTVAQAPPAAELLKSKPLQPHRIAYEIGIDPARSGGSFAGARGLMVLEFGGSACDGYATNFRQVTELVGADGDQRALDFRVNLFEAGDGASFRFTTRNTVNGRVTRDADGEATRRRDGSIAVVMKRPRGKRSDFDGNLVFPSMMTAMLIREAEQGRRSFEQRLFDGSEGGEKAYNVAGVIGPRLEGERNARVEPVLKGNALDNVARWPVTLSYYDDEPGDRVPVYRLKSVTFANGVMGDMVFEFPDFSLTARAVRYEALKEEPCKR